MSISQKSVLKMKSLPARERPGFHVVAGLLGFAWFMVMVWLAGAWHIFHNAPTWSIFICVVDAAFAGYLFYATRRFAYRSFNEFELEAVEDELMLSITDKLANTRTAIEINLAEVDIAEYYPYEDYGSLVLKSADGSHIEIPLWCFIEGGRPVVEYIRSRLVPVVTINQ